MNAALQMKLRGMNVDILPVLIDNCDLPPLFADML